jgi:transposase-like protein
MGKGWFFWVWLRFGSDPWQEWYNQQKRGIPMSAEHPLPPCPNPDCSQPHVIRNGSKNGRKRFHCRGCGRFWGETEGTPLYGLKTPVAEIARALLVVMRRGSLRAAEEITGHKYETIGTWLRRAAEHAAALSEAMSQNLQLSAVEIDEFWSFVQKKTATSRTPAHAGDAWSKTGPRASSRPVPPDALVRTSWTARSSRR